MKMKPEAIVTTQCRELKAHMATAHHWDDYDGPLSVLYAYNHRLEHTSKSSAEWTHKHEPDEWQELYAELDNEMKRR